MKIHNADACMILPQLDPGSFDAVITDPTYSGEGNEMARKQVKMHAEIFF